MSVVLDNMERLANLLLEKSKIISNTSIERRYRKQMKLFSIKDINYYLDSFKSNKSDFKKEKSEITFIIYDERFLNLFKKHFEVLPWIKDNCYKLHKLILFLFLLDKNIISYDKEKKKIIVKPCEIESFDDEDLYEKFF